MRKLYAAGLAIGIVVALGAYVSPAFGVSRILANGGEITAMLEITASGELLLKVLGGIASGAEVLCIGSFDILMETGGILGFVNEVLTQSLTLVAATVADLTANVEGDDLACTPVKLCEVTPTLIVAIHLPWHIEIILDANGDYQLDFLSPNENGTEPGFTADCRVLGITSHIVCEGLTEARLHNDAVSADLVGEFNEASSPAIPCFGAGEGVGADVISEGAVTISDADGALLTVSE